MNGKIVLLSFAFLQPPGGQASVPEVFVSHFPEVPGIYMARHDRQPLPGPELCYDPAAYSVMEPVGSSVIELTRRDVDPKQGAYLCDDPNRPSQGGVRRSAFRSDAVI
jgi:hypothetical protein